MSETVDRLLELALERGAIKYGDFTLTSGKKSRYYFDGRLLSLDPEGAHLIAEALNLTRAEVHGVVSFYHDFRSAPAGRHVLKLCRAEACQSVGADATIQQVLAHFGLDAFGTTQDGRLTIEPVYCLGLCACGPAAMIDGKVLGRADAPRITAALEVQA